MEAVEQQPVPIFYSELGSMRLTVNQSWESHPQLPYSFRSSVRQDLEPWNTTSDHYISLEVGDWIYPHMWQYHDSAWTIGGEDEGWAPASVLRCKDSSYEAGWLPSETLSECLKAVQRTYFALHLGQPNVIKEGWMREHHVSLFYTRQLPPSMCQWARDEGHFLVQKYIKDHYLPHHVVRPRQRMLQDPEQLIVEGEAKYQCHHVAARSSTSYNRFNCMRDGVVRGRPTPLPYLEAYFTEVKTCGQFCTGTLAPCSVTYLAEALQNFIQYEVLPGALEPTETKPVLHVTFKKPT